MWIEATPDRSTDWEMNSMGPLLHLKAFLYLLLSYVNFNPHKCYILLCEIMYHFKMKNLEMK